MRLRNWAWSLFDHSPSDWFAAIARKSTSIGLIAMFSLAAFAPRAMAEQTSQTVDLTGSVRANVWSHSRELDEIGPASTVSVWLRSKVRVDDSSAVVADAWMQRADNVNRSTDEDSHVRELYWKYRAGNVDVRIGRQLLIWGRADGINPTDYFGGRDFTVLTFEDTDQRIGSDGIAATYFIPDGFGLQMVWLPRFRTDTVPVRSQPMQSVGVADPTRRDQWAVKLDHSGGDIDWSVSYFDGYDRMPDLSIAAIDAAGLKTVLSNHRVRAVGADASSTIGSYVLRGEIAWMDRSKDGTADDFFRKKSQLSMIVGGDRNFGESVNLNLQLFALWIPEYRNPDQLTNEVARAVAVTQSALNNQSGKSQYGFTYRLGTSWRNDTWQAEVSGAYSFTTHGKQIRGQIKHAIDDKWHLNVGIERFNGSDDTVFGQLQRNSTAFAELRYVF